MRPSGRYTLSAVTYSPLAEQMPPGSLARILAQNSVSGRGWACASAAPATMPVSESARAAVVKNVFISGPILAGNPLEATI